MYLSLARIAAAILIAAAGIYFSIRLAVYADKDDSPGGMVIGVLLMFCSAGFGLWLALRQPGKPSGNGGGAG